MKILFLSDDFPPLAKGGGSILAFRLAQGLLRAGHQLYLITTVQQKDQAGELEYQGIKYFRIYANYHERWRAYLSLYNPQTIRRVESIIKSIKPDIVHAFNIHYYLSYHCLKIAKKYSPAVFLTACDTMLFCYGKFDSYINPNNLSVPLRYNYRMSFWDLLKQAKKRYNPLRNLINRYYLKYVDKIFSPSRAIKEALESNGIKNIDVIYCGIDLSDWDIEESYIDIFKERYGLFGGKIIFFGGRLSKAKGGEKIILAMKRIIKEIPNVILLIAGHKEGYAQKMISLTKQLKIENNLVFTGWLNGKDIKAAYHSCDLGVFPSIYLDGFGLVNLETMAAKKPMVSTCFGGASEIVINNQTGYIVNPFNIEMLEEKILDLLKNPDKAKQFGEASYERVKKYFSLKEQVDRTFNYYYHFLNGSLK